MQSGGVHPFELFAVMPALNFSSNPTKKQHPKNTAIILN
jgi:hypothetical protein